MIFFTVHEQSLKLKQIDNILKSNFGYSTELFRFLTTAVQVLQRNCIYSASIQREFWSDFT